MMEEIDLPEELAEAIINATVRKPKTITTHYGLKEEEYKQFVKDMLCSLIQHKTRSVTIDKFFGKLSAEDRVKVVAFAEALDKLERLEMK